MWVWLCCVLLLFVGWSHSLPTQDASALTFEDIDTRSGYIAGTAYVTRASNETDISYYVIYFSSNTTSPASKLQLDLGYPHRAVVDNIALPNTANPAHPSGQIALLIPPIEVPSSAQSLIVISKNNDGEKADTSAILSISDSTSTTLPLCRNVTLNYPSGAIDDGSGDSNYTSAVEQGEYICNWTISNTNIDKFLFRVTYLELDPFEYDSLCIYDDSTSATLACFTQSTGPNRDHNIISTSNQISVVLNVTGSVSGGGFRAVYYGLDTKDYENSVDDSVMKIRFDQHIPVECHCMDVDCQSQSSNCYVDQGNGKGWSTCANLGTCPDP